jgi:hypothetical protein
LFEDREMGFPVSQVPGDQDHLKKRSQPRWASLMKRTAASR